MMIDSVIPIILAAGKGSRFGKEIKLLHNIDNKFILEKAIESYIDNFNIIIVILGPESIKIQEKLNALGYTNIKTVINEQWQTGGMSSSVKKGVEFAKVNYDCKGILIQPGDMPFITQNDIEKICEKAEAEGYQKIVIPQFKGKNGHPLFIPKSLFLQVAEISEASQGLKGLLIEQTDIKTFVQCGKGILKDIDTRNDLNT